MERKPIEEVTFDDFVKALDELQSNEDITVSESGERFFTSHPEKTSEESDISYVEGLCNVFLITSDGGCNWENIRKLRNMGYDVYAGDKDSFGWLTGCVENQNTRNILVYG